MPVIILKNKYFPNWSSFEMLQNGNMLELKPLKLGRCVPGKNVTKSAKIINWVY